MFTRKQYLRLLLVLLLPLLLLGLLLLEEEILILFPHHYVIECESDSAQPHSCVSHSSITRSRAYELENSASITVRRSGLLRPGFFRHEVMLHAIQESGAAAPPPPPSRTILTLPPPGERRLLLGSLQGYCDLSPYHDSNRWLYRCRFTGETGIFEFVDEEVNQRFRAIDQTVSARLEESERRAFFVRVFSTLVPIGAFLLLSLAWWTLVKAARFVIGDKAPG
jgi:hypothetical protein